MCPVSADHCFAVWWLRATNHRPATVPALRLRQAYCLARGLALPNEVTEGCEIQLSNACTCAQPFLSR